MFCVCWDSQLPLLSWPRETTRGSHTRGPWPAGRHVTYTSSTKYDTLALRRFSTVLQRQTRVTAYFLSKQQSRDIEPLLVQCWFNVGPASFAGTRASSVEPRLLGLFVFARLSLVVLNLWHLSVLTTWPDSRKLVVIIRCKSYNKITMFIHDPHILKIT